MAFRTRFAPSPTGNLHIGGARTALFSYLWAKKHHGEFVLRIEDTDQQREKPESLRSILDGLRWLGLEWDEGPEHDGPHAPYFQSQRTALYRTYVQQLIDAGKAYHCFCTPERLAQMRQEQQEHHLPPRYDRTCRGLSREEVQEALTKGTPSVVRLAVPEEGSVTLHDVVRGSVTFEYATVDDQVLLKSDGFPTYHLANVVDDHEMEVTHVIRGEDWLPSTPKHLLLYEAFGWTAPTFAHLSLFLSSHGGKMSKRDGETALLAFRDLGYLADAVVNYIALLGWNPKTTEEMFTLQQLIERFDLAQVNPANAIFDREKLGWMNQQYLRRLSIDDVRKEMRALSMLAVPEYAAVYAAFLEWLEPLPQANQASLWTQFQQRCTTLLDIAHTVDTRAYVPSYNANDIVWKKSTRSDTLAVLEAVCQYIGTIAEDQFLAAPFEQLIRQWIVQQGKGNGEVLWPLRFALSGQPKSPSPFELAEVLGKGKTMERLAQAITALRQL